MGRSTKLGFGTLGAAALTLSLTAVVQAQQVRSNVSPATEAQIAASPVVKRLRELLEVVNSGDAAAMHAYLQMNGVDATKPPSAPPQAPRPLPLVGQVLDLHRRSQGLDLVRVETVEDSGAVAIVRNKLTGDDQAIAIKVEPQAPHRITGLP